MAFFAHPHCKERAHDINPVSPQRKDGDLGRARLLPGTSTAWVQALDKWWLKKKNTCQCFNSFHTLSTLGGVGQELGDSVS